jgi:hypothetical protein
MATGNGSVPASSGRRDAACSIGRVLPGGLPGSKRLVRTGAHARINTWPEYNLHEVPREGKPQVSTTSHRVLPGFGEVGRLWEATRRRQATLLIRAQRPATKGRPRIPPAKPRSRPAARSDGRQSRARAPPITSQRRLRFSRSCTVSVPAQLRLGGRRGAGRDRRPAHRHTTQARQ